MRPPVASHSMRYLFCHFATSGALSTSHQRIIFGKSASGLSLVAFFGIKKNIVVQACCCHLPQMFHPLQELHHFSSCFSCQIPRNVGMKAIAPCSCLCLVTLRRLLQITFFFTSACPPPASSTPHFSTACPLRLALPDHIARLSPTLASSLHIWLEAWHSLLPSSETVILISRPLAW